MYNLVIIGNGFDLAHDLKTSYRHFLNHVNKNARIEPDKYSDLLRDEFIGIFRAKQSVRRDQKIFKNTIVQELLNLGHLNNWSDIEFHYFKLINAANTKNINSINNEFEQIKNHLKIYLSNEQNGFKAIESYEFFFSKLNHHNTLILNFNYTNTVEKYLEKYKNIKHIAIHGELNNEDNPMIFGFAASDAESKVLIDRNEEGYMRNIKKLNYMFTNNDKELKSLMDDSRKFDVIILGHSCGVSDRLILSEIFNHKKLNSITPFYFKNREGYLQTIINIDRIIDDYTKKNKEDKSFNKLENYPQCFSMIQHNSTSDEITKFKNYITAHKINKANRYDPPPMVVGVF
ncbi:MAG: AbiH family protein [Draconibacterium sp.]